MGSAVCCTSVNNKSKTKAKKTSTNINTNNNNNKDKINDINSNIKNNNSGKNNQSLPSTNKPNPSVQREINKIQLDDNQSSIRSIIQSPPMSSTQRIQKPNEIQLTNQHTHNSNNLPMNIMKNNTISLANNEMIININHNNEDINSNVSINDEFQSSSSSIENSNRNNSISSGYFCNRCNSNFVTLTQYSNHIPFCLEVRDEVNINRNINEMHNSLNQILNLVHSIHTQLNTNGMMAILGYGECEEATEYFDWEFVKSEGIGIEIGGVWKNNGKVKLTKNQLKEIEEMSIEKIKSERYFIKRIWLLKYINMKIYDKSNDNTPLVISRENILEESFNQFKTTNELDLKRGMHIFFVDEVAQDVGGVYREWYNCLFKDIFSALQNFFYECPNKGLGKNTYLISNSSPTFHKDDELKYYEFIGKVIAKALFDKITININLNYILIKQLLKRSLSLTDIAYYDIDLFTSLSSILSNKQLEPVLPFTWNIRNENGELIDIELVPNGRNVYVDESNKKQFVAKVINLIAYDSVKPKLTALLKGFDSVISNDIISIFSPEEFDFILSGQTLIDLEDWKRNTVYKGYYSERHWIIKTFWEILGELKPEELVVFFKFCTGCNRVPIDGFNSLQGTRNKLLKFSIESPLKKEQNEDGRLIEAKTCFNRITLPEYQSKQQMKKAIYTIINNDTNFFGLQ